MESSDQMASRDVSPLEPHEEVGRATSGRHSLSSATEAKIRPLRVIGKEVKILFFSANAVPGKSLAIDEEHRAIEQSLASSRYREAFVVIAKLAAREGDLQQALLQHQPDIVHFACHGNVEAELVLLGKEGGAAALSPASLNAMVRALGGQISLVVFNACWSREQAEAIRANVGLAVGMREPIGDAEAIKFASAFYNALGHARSVRNAFDWGLAAIKPRSASRREVPELFEAADIQASDVVFAGQAGQVPQAGQRGRGRRGVAVSMISGALALVAWRAWPAEAPPGPLAGMVRVTGATLPSERLGSMDRLRLPAACRAVQATEECPNASLAPSSGVRVPTFDLDRNEVNHREFAAWLHTQALPWTIAKHGRVMTQSAPSISLALIAPECGGGLIITPEGQLRAAVDKADWPVTCVTWHGANEYCRGQGKRLPLASEWQLAARGPEGRLFPWGAELPRQDVVAFDLGDGATKHPRPVGTSLQDVTPEGISDLGGNVGEWVADESEGIEGSEGREREGREGTGGAGSSPQKMIRGGTWASLGPCHLLGSRCRRKAAESYLADVGFRCARSVLDPSLERKASP